MNEIYLGTISDDALELLAAKNKRIESLEQSLEQAQRELKESE